MRSVQVASKDAILTGSVNKSRDGQGCVYVFVMLSAVLYLSFDVE